MRKVLFSSIAITVLASCSGYELTFNNQSIYSPPTLYTDYVVEDAALQNCLTQTIMDENIVDAKDLRSLNCAYAGIENLSGLTHFKWLETINFSSNNIRDVKPLMFLGRLQDINLEGNNLLSCQAIFALEKLITNKLVAPDHCLN